MRISEALDLWLLALETEGRRPATLATYRWHWTPFLHFLEGHGITDLDDLTPFIVRRYLAEYQKGHSPVSLKSVYNSIQAFVRWAGREGLLKADPLKNVRPPKVDVPTKSALSQGQARALFAVLQADKSPTGLRNLALVALICDTGARASEVCAITLSDVVGDTVVLRRTKNGKPRVAFLGKRSSQAPVRYLAYGRPKLHPQSDRLFLTHDGRPVSRFTLLGIFKRLSAKVGLKVTPHLLRHSWATQMARAGVHPNALMALAGWSEIEMAQRYVHMTTNDLRKAHESARPLDGVL